MKPLVAMLSRDVSNLIQWQVWMQQGAIIGGQQAARSTAEPHASTNCDSSPVDNDSRSTLCSLLTSLTKKKRLACNQKILESLRLMILSENEDSHNHAAAEEYILQYLSELMRQHAATSTKKKRHNNYLQFNLAVVPLLRDHPKRFEMLVGSLRVLLKSKSKDRWEKTTEVIEAICDLISMEATSQQISEIDEHNWSDALLECFSCMLQLTQQQQQQRCATHVLKQLLRMCRLVYAVQGVKTDPSRERQKESSILHFMVYLIEHAKDVSVVNCAMVLLCEVVALRTSLVLKTKYNSILNAVSSRLLDERKTVRSTALKALHILIPLNPFVKSLRVIEKIEHVKQELEQRIEALVEHMGGEYFSREKVKNALGVLAERVISRQNPDEGFNWDSMEGLLAVLLEERTEYPPSLVQRIAQANFSLSHSLVATHNKLQECRRADSFLSTAQEALSKVMCLFTLMAGDSSLVDAKCLAMIKGMLTEDACFGCLPLDWRALFACMRHSEPLIRSASCGIILHQCVSNSGVSIDWRYFEKVTADFSADELKELGRELVQYDGISPKQKVAIQRVIAEVFAQASPSQADSSTFRTQLSFLVIFNQIMPKDCMPQLLEWFRLCTAATAPHLHMICCLLSEVMQKWPQDTHNSYHKELLEAIEKSFSVLIVSEDSIDLMIQCFHLGLAPLYKYFVNFERQIIEDTEFSSDFKLSSLLCGTNVLLRVAHECWRFQSEEQWREKACVQVDDEMEDIQNHDSPEEDYLREHRQKLRKEMFVSEYVQEMLHKSFVARYITFAGDVCASNEMRETLCVDSESILEWDKGALNVILSALKVAATCTEISPLHAPQFVQFLNDCFMCGRVGKRKQSGDDPKMASDDDDLLQPPFQEDRTESVALVRLAAFQRLCHLMRHTPNLVEEKIEYIFDHMDALLSANDSFMRQCIILLIGKLCIEKMFRSQHMVVYIAEFLIHPSEQMQQVARSFLKRFLSLNGDENAAEQALNIILKVIETHTNRDEAEGEWLGDEDVCADIEDVSTFLLHGCLKKRDREGLVQKILEEFTNHPSVVLSSLVKLHVASHEKSAQSLKHFISIRGLYFFRRLRESKGIDSIGVQSIFQNLRACLERATKKFKNMLGSVDVLVRVFRHSEKWDEDVHADPEYGGDKWTDLDEDEKEEETDENVIPEEEDSMSSGS